MIGRWIFHPERQLGGRAQSNMPLYTVMTQDGLLSAEQRDVIAAEIVRIHTAAMSVPAHFVHSIFPTYPRNHAYVAATRSSVASILAVIRAGHTPEEKTRLVQALWKMFQDQTSVSDRDLSVALQEVPASQAMENGAMMPDVGHGKERS
jgi:phenylpyruvate tautomerase PptA (4-oxalocrotonate tautomerase family)